MTFLSAKNNQKPCSSESTILHEDSLVLD